MNTDIYDAVFSTLVAVLHRKTKLDDFSQWLYRADYMNYMIGIEFYEELLGVDYFNTEATSQVDKTILSILQRFRPNLYDDEYIRDILCKIASGTMDIRFACSQLAQRHNSGYDWIPVIFVGLDSELDAAKSGREPWIEHYKQIAKDEAHKLLSSRFPGIRCA